MASTFGNSALGQLLDDLWTCANNTSGGRPFGAIFDTSNGNYINGSMKWVCLLTVHLENLV